MAKSKESKFCRWVFPISGGANPAGRNDSAVGTPFRDTVSGKKVLGKISWDLLYRRGVPSGGNFPIREIPRGRYLDRPPPSSLVSRHQAKVQCQQRSGMSPRPGLPREVALDNR